MENSNLYLNKIMLNITTSKEQNLNFVKGEVLRGVVQGVRADGLVSLFIKGQTIDALSEVLVQSGQHLQLMVEDFRDGRAYLKVITPQLMERIENTNISLNLSEVGIPAKGENIMMARKLLHYQLPVTSDNLNLMGKTMTILGGASEKNAEIAAFSIARSIPLDGDSLKSLAQFLSLNNDISRLLGGLDKGLWQLEELLVPKEESGRSNPGSSLQQNAGKDSEPAYRHGLSGDRIATAANASLAATAAKGTEALQTPGRDAGISQGSSSAAKGGEMPLSAEGKGVSVQASPAAETKIPAPVDQEQGKIKLEALLTSSSKNVSEQRLELRYAGHNNPIASEKAPDMALPSSSSSAAQANKQVVISPAPPSPAMADRAMELALSTIRTLLGQISVALDKVENELAIDNGRVTAKNQNPSPLKATPLPLLADGKLALESIADSKGVESPKELINRNAAGVEKSAFSHITSMTDSEIERQAPEIKLLTVDGKTPTAPEPLRHLSLLRTLLEIISLNLEGLEGDAGKAGGKLQNAVLQEREIIRGLNILQDIIKNDLTLAKSPLIADLINKIEGMERELSAQRILNFAGRGVMDSSSNYFYFAFPVQWGEEYRLGQMKINRELGSRGLDKQDNISFVVSLDTVQMGVVLFHIDWKRKGELVIQGVVERQEIREYLNRNLGDLFQALEKLGYQVKNLGIKVLEREEEMKLRLALQEEKMPRLRPFGIDLRV